MPTTNREVFQQDPTKTTIPNDGVAKVLDPRTPEEWKVLRYELESFVCDGEYRRGMERILSTYLGHLDKQSQPAAWISGFYGSGKSHFVRVLEYLWRDVTFDGGATARGLTHLPHDLKDYLTELSTAGRREGGLWSAAGKLSSGPENSVRLTMLSILFRSAGLPDQYPAARFVLWLKQNGYYEAVKAGVEAAGKNLDTELINMYVSPYIAKSLRQVYPNFAATDSEARGLLRTQYPPNQTDISDDEMVLAMENVMALQSNTPGKLPLTLLVFDELQQFIGEDPGRTLLIQNVVEACCSRFGSRLLFVATGQAALQGTTQLSKLKGRFTVNVTLSDTDVDQVVRAVVLRKAPDKEALLKETLEKASGEIDRHLQGTNISPTASDSPYLLTDYPLLPARRRFWERVLRAVDSAGSAGQLRTQLRIVHESVK
ncbi:MAG: BREX system P-loop protein BrxC, partial [Chloroflexota bacterium]